MTMTEDWRLMELFGDHTANGIFWHFLVASREAQKGHHA